MKINSRNRTAGELEVSTGKVVFLFLFVVIAWSVYNLTMAYYTASLVDNEITVGLLASRNEVFNETKVAEDIKARVKMQGPIAVDEKALSILRGQDGQTATASVPYVYQIHIPLTSMTWDIHFNPVIQENVIKKGL